MVTVNVGALIAALGLPSALIAFLFWNLERKITARDRREEEQRRKRDAEEKKKDEARQSFELNIVRGVSTAVHLSVATARAMQRIPEAHCNGDMSEALDKAVSTQNDLDSFIAAQAINHLNN